MMPRHGAVFDFAAQAITHHEAITFAPLGDEPWNFREVMAAIGIAHDDEAAPCLFDAFAQGAAVPFHRGVHYARAVSF